MTIDWINADATDDGSACAVAQSVRSDVGALTSMSGQRGAPSLPVGITPVGTLTGRSGSFSGSAVHHSIAFTDTQLARFQS